MDRINIYIDKKQGEYLEKLSQDGVTLSEHIRRAIDEYIERLESLKVTISPSKHGKK
jgi:predicted component of type VI protein secretion system